MILPQVLVEGVGGRIGVYLPQRPAAAPTVTVLNNRNNAQGTLSSAATTLHAANSALNQTGGASARDVFLTLDDRSAFVPGQDYEIGLLDPEAANTVPYEQPETIRIRGYTSTANQVVLARPLLYDHADNSPVYSTLATVDAFGERAFTSGTLVNAKQYTLTTYVAGDDFSNIGGTNTEGETWTTTGTTPTDWTNGSTVTQVTDVSGIWRNGRAIFTWTDRAGIVQNTIIRVDAITSQLDTYGQRQYPHAIATEQDLYDRNPYWSNTMAEGVDVRSMLRLAEQEVLARVEASGTQARTMVGADLIVDAACYWALREMWSLNADTAGEANPFHERFQRSFRQMTAIGAADENQDGSVRSNEGIRAGGAFKIVRRS